MNLLSWARHLIALGALALVTACTINSGINQPTSSATELGPMIPQIENAIAERLFRQALMQLLARIPEQSIRLRQGQSPAHWNDTSAEFQAETLRLLTQQLQLIESSVDINSLDSLNFAIYDSLLHMTRLPQTRGAIVEAFAGTPLFPHNLVTISTRLMQVQTVEDAEFYLDLLGSSDELIDGYITNLSSGDVFASEAALSTTTDLCDELLRGAPFEETMAPNLLYAAFITQVDRLGLKPDVRDSLLRRARSIMRLNLQPALLRLREFLPAFSANLAIDPQRGAPEHLTNLLQMEIGANAAELQAELENLLQSTQAQLLNHTNGTLDELHHAYIHDPENYLADTDQGRQQYLDLFVDWMNVASEQVYLFANRIPMVDISIKASDDRLGSASEMEYWEPSSDGVRPGMLEVVLSDMRAHPLQELQALVYRSTVPGWHLLYASRPAGLMPYYFTGPLDSYRDGWGLYVTWLADHFGLYAGESGNLGYLLQMEWAVSLAIVDLHINRDGWSQEQVASYLSHNSSRTDGAIKTAIIERNRSPGRSLLGLAGFLTFRSGYQEAITRLGEKFSVADLNSYLLELGPLPLPVLDTMTSKWLESVSSDPAKQVRLE